MAAESFRPRRIDLPTGKEANDRLRHQSQLATTSSSSAAVEAYMSAENAQKTISTASIISASMKRFIEQQEAEQRLSKPTSSSAAASRHHASSTMLGGQQLTLNGRTSSFSMQTNIDKLPEKLLSKIFSYVPHRDMLRLMLVSRKWHSLLTESTLWRFVNFRVDYGGLPINNVDALTTLVGTRLGNTLQSIELPCDLVTVPVLHELASKCPNVRSLTLDFSNAMQLHDYSDLNAFPCNLNYLCICLSDVIFMEGLMRRIYSCLSSVQVLHLIGTFESTNETTLAAALTATGKEAKSAGSAGPAPGSGNEVENYEVINLTKLRSSMPNLRVINLYGILFINDTHVEIIVQSSLQLEALALNYCMNVKGYSFKLMIQKCRRLKTLLLQHCELESQAVEQADWQDAVNMTELDISCTELTDECLQSMFLRLPKLTYLSVSYVDGFTDRVMDAMISKEKLDNIRAIDLSYTNSISEPMMMRFIKAYGPRLVGLMANGKPKLSESFWLQSIGTLHELRTCVLGTANGWYLGISTRVHVDQIIAKLAQSCPHLECIEIQWDPDTIRFSEKSSKFIDLLRMRCPYLQKITLSDGEYYEIVRANFVRSGVGNAVRTTTMYNTSLVNFLHHYKDLKFN